MPDADAREAVRKAIYDNLRDLGPAEMDSICNSEGKTCRQALRQRKVQNFAEPDRYPCGKLFYAELRKVFRSSDHPLSQIAEVAAGYDESVNPCLLKSMQEFQKFGKRAGMLGYLSLATELTRSEVFGLWTFCWQMRPESPAQGNINQCYQCLEAFARLQLHSDDRYQIHFPLIYDWCDRVLCQTLKSLKGAKNTGRIRCESQEGLGISDVHREA